VHDAVGIDPEQIAVKGEMVDRTGREAVDDRGDPSRVGVRDDVGGLDDRALRQRAAWLRPASAQSRRMRGKSATLCVTRTRCSAAARASTADHG
jgi:hypothetical protein